LSGSALGRVTPCIATTDANSFQEEDFLIACAERRRAMVTKYTKHGYPYKTPPYTEEEIDEFDRVMDNVGSITVVYSGPAGNRYKAPRRQSQSRTTTTFSIERGLQASTILW
jgi:hypothetical protein